MPDQHAQVTASGAERWMHCPPSVRMAEDFPDTASEAAAEGTEAHALAEKKLNAWLNTGRRQRFKNDDETMQEATDNYRDYILQIFNDLKAQGQNPFLKVEVRLDLSSWIPEGFGTSDAVIISGDTLHIIDFKYGKGVQVDAPENPQMRLYALGAVNLYQEVFEFTRVKTHIFQPRLDHISTEDITVQDLLAWGETVKPLAKMAFDGTGEQQTGKWCQFCRCACVCKVRADEMFGVLKDQPEPETLTNAQIAEYLPKLDQAVKWANAMQEYAQKKALDGEKFPGWKLVAGRSVRKIKDPEAFAAAMAGNGYADAEIWKPRTLQTLTALEKTVGKKTFATDYAQYIEKPKGKPVLVPESDKRPELAVQDADEMFGKPLKKEEE